MTDVAAHAGVSRATVSYVLSGSDLIPEETANRVRKAAADLNYRANATARALRTQKSKTLGLIGDRVATTPYAGQLISGAQAAAWEMDFMLLVVDSGGDPAIEREAFRQLNERQVEGFLYASVYTREVADPSSWAQGLPIVLANCFTKSGPVSSVLPDEYAGGRAAAEMLVDQGHRRIGFLGGDADVWAYDEREKGFRDVMAERSITLDQAVVVRGHADPVTGRNLASELLNASPLTALLCGNDRMAMGAYEAARDHGIDVPADLSIVGYDDQEMAQFMFPPLSTIQLPHYDIGREACMALLAHILDAGAAAPLIERKVTCPPVARASVSAAAGLASKP